MSMNLPKPARGWSRPAAGAALLCVAVSWPAAAREPAVAAPPAAHQAIDPKVELARKQALKANAPHIEQQTRHWEQQVRPLLWAELERLRRIAADLPADARKTITAAGNQAVQAASRGLAEQQFGARQPDSRELSTVLHEAIAPVVKPLVSAEAFTAFEAEETARRERTARAARLLIVSRIDERLQLSAAQREAIEADLTKQWQSAWLPFSRAHVTVNNMPWAPDFAEACVAPHLDERQRAEWKPWSEQAGTKRVGGFNNGHFQVWPGQVWNDPGRQPDPWWNP